MMTGVYGKRLLIQQLKSIMEDSKASIAQKLQAAKLIAEVQGWTNKKHKKINTNLLGVK